MQVNSSRPATPAALLFSFYIHDYYIQALELSTSLSILVDDLCHDVFSCTFLLLNRAQSCLLASCIRSVTTARQEVLTACSFVIRVDKSLCPQHVILETSTEVVLPISRIGLFCSFGPKCTTRLALWRSWRKKMAKLLKSGGIAHCDDQLV